MPVPADLVERLRVAGCVFPSREAAVLAETAGEDSERLEALVRRREAGERLEHVVGWAELGGVRVVLRPGVFVPRPRSALLVDLALPHLRTGAAVVDLCCGSGVLAAAIVASAPGVTAYAIDSDPRATACARENLAPHHVVLQGDLYEPLPRELCGRVDVIVASAPYVPSAEVAGLPRDAREREPRLALDGGDDGLDLYRRIAAGALPWLAPEGTLLIETARHQAGRAAALLDDVGLRSSIETDDGLDSTAVVGVVQPRLRRRAV